MSEFPTIPQDVRMARNHGVVHLDADVDEAVRVVPPLAVAFPKLRVEEGSVLGGTPRSSRSTSRPG